jgi:hypothetical protein
MTRSLCLTQRSDGPATVRLAWLLPLVAVLTLGLPPLFGESSFAQDETSNVEPADDGTVDVSHEQWLERIAEAKRRSHQFAVEQWKFSRWHPLARRRGANSLAAGSQ